MDTAVKMYSVIRFRNGDAAIMRVEKMDTLCGYATYHGTHLYGEWISIAANDFCRPVTKAEMKKWEEFRGERKSYTESMKLMNC